MDLDVKNWLAMVDYDVKTAAQMLKTGRYVYVVFMCHLAIEKVLKAGVCRKVQRVPPKTHDLIYLISLIEINMPDDLLNFIGMINNAAVVTRYPEDLPKLVSSYPKSIAQKYLDQTRRVIKWIKKNLELKK